MSKLSYVEFKEAIAQASALELTGVIHLATNQLQSLHATPMEAPFSLRADARTMPIEARGLDVTIYLAGCTGLRQRSVIVGRPIYKIGTTTRRDVDGRVNDLSKVRYAGYDPHSGGHCEGFDDYTRIAFKEPGQALPQGLRLHDGCLVAELPPNLSRSQFEARFRQALMAHSVSEWAQSGDGEACLSTRGLHVEQLPTLTRFAYGAVRAKELYVLSAAPMTMIVAKAAASVCGRGD
ncbi:hypothetical protein [Bosea sp. RAC05]|jgi:hypothetical protein|uniref:hypothetical protein n=1 Tax=Bosea sp. RAC05 TaxID=1842539 RepID=UPI001237139F|nr:hypothetical protein [Bosea sp. RAC05]